MESENSTQNSSFLNFSENKHEWKTYEPPIDSVSSKQTINAEMNDQEKNDTPNLTTEQTNTTNDEISVANDFDL